MRNMMRGLIVVAAAGALLWLAALPGSAQTAAYKAPRLKGDVRGGVARVGDLGVDDRGDVHHHVADEHAAPWPTAPGHPRDHS